MFTNTQEQKCAETQNIGKNEFLSHPDGIPYRVIQNVMDRSLQVEGDENHWLLSHEAEQLTLIWPTSSMPTIRATLAAIESTFAFHPKVQVLNLQIPISMYLELLHAGIVVDDGTSQPYVHAEMFWQQPSMWLPSTRPLPYPQQFTLSEGRRHPRRPPKPSGTVYQRYIAWLNTTLSFKVIDLEQDLQCFNRWMNDPIVAHFWEEQGNLAQHRERLKRTLQNTSVLPLIGYFGNEPFGYFEIYWAKEDRIGIYYNAADFDRGWHVLIGEPSFRGSPYTAAWLPSISHYLFLDDCRTQRLVIEPRVDNTRMLRNLSRCGYSHIKEFDFPHKRAMLGMQLRERFFNDRCWVPHSPHPGSASPFDLINIK